MKKIAVPIVTIFVFVTCVTLYFWLAPFPPKNAPDISLNVIDGRKIDFKSFQGKPLLVTFWATTCSTCLQEMPHLVELYNELNQEGFEIIGVAMSYDPPNRVVKLSQRKNIPYSIALDIDGSAAAAFGNVQATPTSFLINANGIIVQKNTGELNFDNLRKKVKKLLQTNPTKIT